MNAPCRMTQAAGHLKTLAGFINPQQLEFIGDCCRGEERDFFFDKLAELAQTVSTMPKTYEQSAKGEEAVAYLHYFINNCDFFITEKDVDGDHSDGGGHMQAFGLADLGFGPELGYINIAELLENNVELDLHFTPTTLAALKAAREKA